jgi:hypothetical protein
MTTTRTFRVRWKSEPRTAGNKVVLFEVGSGVCEQVLLKGYPRWSASIWDLAARAIAVAFSKDPRNPEESVPHVECDPEEFAFADCLSAAIQHIPNVGAAIRQLGTMEIIGDEFERGFYGVTINEELMPALRPAPFFFVPKFLRPSDLVLRAAATVVAIPDQTSVE